MALEMRPCWGEPIERRGDVDPEGPARPRHLQQPRAPGLTCLSALAGLTSLRQIGPARLTLAVPILDGAILRRVEPLVDALEWLKLVGGLGAVGAWYEDFPQLQDDQVLELLAGRGARAASAGSGWPGRET